MKDSPGFSTEVLLLVPALVPCDDEEATAVAEEEPEVPAEENVERRDEEEPSAEAVLEAPHWSASKIFF